MTRNRRQPAPRTLAALAAFAVAACGGPADGGERPAGADTAGGTEAHRAAPDFALETLEGDTLRLADLADREAILMNFWASWCAPCRAEIPDLIELHEAYRDEGFTVLGVAVNDLPRDSRDFVEEMGMTYPSVIGTPAMLESYELSPWLPTTLLVVDGQIVREWVGPRARQEFEYAIRVALGKAPPLEDVLHDPPGGTPADGR